MVDILTVFICAGAHDARRQYPAPSIQMDRVDGGYIMQTVTVSHEFQVRIPVDVRESLCLRPGQKMQVVEYEGRIELIPDRDISELRGFIKGVNTDFEREKDRV